MLSEPKIHSHIEDVLPGDHPLAYEVVCCESCKVMVHAFNNECMQTWIETGNGNFCVPCFFSTVDQKVLDRVFGLIS